MNSQNVEYLILQRLCRAGKQSAQGAVCAVGGQQACAVSRLRCTGALSWLWPAPVVDARLIRQLCPGIKTAVAPNVVDAREYEIDGRGRSVDYGVSGRHGLVSQPRCGGVLRARNLSAGTKGNPRCAADHLRDAIPPLSSAPALPMFPLWSSPARCLIFGR